MHRHTCASLLNMGCDEDTVLIYNNMENNACQKKKGKKKELCHTTDASCLLRTVSNCVACPNCKTLWLRCPGVPLFECDPKKQDCQACQFFFRFDEKCNITKSCVQTVEIYSRKQMREQLQVWPYICSSTKLYASALLRCCS